MSLLTLARICFIAGAISCALILPFSFTGVPAGTAGKVLATLLYIGLAVCLVASLTLWVLDFIILARTWQSRNLAQNIAHICVLLVLTFFGAYISYFLLRPSPRSQTPSGNALVGATPSLPSAKRT
jgi:hypothetical protein